MSGIKGCMNCGNITCPNNKKRDCIGCGRWISPEDKIKEYEAQIEKMKCCENCAWWYKLPNGQRDCAETCENRDNWSLRR